MPEVATAHSAPLRASWREGGTIVNLRGDPDDRAFTQAVADALGLALPLTPCSRMAAGALQILWAGPDDWFVIDASASMASCAERVARLRAAVAGRHAAVTDVSSGYTVLELAGSPAREVLAEGCPLDLHPRVFPAGHCAGSHFFKASVWLWQTSADPAAGFGLLVRRSFAGYVQLMLEQATRECGLQTHRELAPQEGA